MAQQTPAYVISNAIHPAYLFRQQLTSMFFGPNGGVFSADEYGVHQQVSPNMSVYVLGGRILIPGTQGTTLSVGDSEFSTQGHYFGFNDAVQTLTLATSDPVNARIDAVYVAVQDSFYSGGTDQVVLGVLTGVPGVSPVIPSLPNNGVYLAAIAVAANATTIVDANITDRRYTAVCARLSGGFARFKGYLPNSTSVTANTNMAFTVEEDEDLPSTGGWDGGNKWYLVRYAGDYAVSAAVKCNSTPAQPNVVVTLNGSTLMDGATPASDAGAGDAMSGVFRLQKNDKIAVQSANAYVTNSASSQYDNFLRVTQVGWA